ncbi:MAG: type II toxin-antitoxin system HicA family toxin [Brevinematia bacterium]
MSNLANISGKKALSIFKKFGYSLDHQTGSHMIVVHPERPTLSIPNHEELAPSLLIGLIKKSGIELEDFLKYK